MRYTVIIEKDLPGCVAVGKTHEEVELLIREAIELHLRGMQEDGDPIPASSSTAIVVQVAADAFAVTY